MYMQVWIKRPEEETGLPQDPQIQEPNTLRFQPLLVKSVGSLGETGMNGDETLMGSR